MICVWFMNDAAATSINDGTDAPMKKVLARFMLVVLMMNALVSDAPVEMVNDDRDVMETEDPDDSTANLAILDLPTRYLLIHQANP